MMRPAGSTETAVDAAVPASAAGAAASLVFRKRRVKLEGIGGNFGQAAHDANAGLPDAVGA